MEILKREDIKKLHDEYQILKKRLDEVQKILYSDKELDLNDWARLYGEEFEISLSLLGATTDLKTRLNEIKTTQNELEIKRIVKEINATLGELNETD